MSRSPAIPELMSSSLDDNFLRRVNEWYDQRMFAADVRSEHDFGNYGYWDPTTTTHRQACENLVDRLLEFLPEKKSTILDVACGKGATTAHLLKYYSPDQISAINISAKQLERAKRNATGCNFTLMDATQLNFASATFQNVICVEAAFHFDTRARFLQETLRVLKEGGRVVLSDILYNSLYNSPPGLGRLVPYANFISNLTEYEALYRNLGYENVQIVDATYNCWILFMRRALRVWGMRLRTHTTSKAQYDVAVRRLFWNRDHIRYYVLASAQKPG